MPGELRFAGHRRLWIFLTFLTFRLWIHAKAL
jgi:hypothetical protein